MDTDEWMDGWTGTDRRTDERIDGWMCDYISVGLLLNSVVTVNVSTVNPSFVSIALHGWNVAINADNLKPLD